MSSVTGSEISSLINAAYQTMSGWEVVAVVLALVYLLLAMKERIECWYAAFVSTGIYIFLFWDVNLLMESALQVYYLLMAVYGWYQWREKSSTEQSVAIHLWSMKQHLLTLSSLAVLVIISGYLLAKNTNAAWPYIDSFTTWGSVITTYMVTKKILENWIYWLLIDSVSVFLYIDRGLYLTALLFLFYLIIVCFGYVKWLQTYRLQNQVVLT